MRSKYKKMSPRARGRGLSVALGAAALGLAGHALAADAPKTLSTVTVSADADGGALAPTSGYTVKTSTSATKTDTPLKETPQSVSVVTRKQIEDQRPRTVTEALDYTPGAFSGLVGSATRYDYVALRGFKDSSTASVILDGLRLLSDGGAFSAMQVDPWLVERIDVFRGPSSVLYGRSTPGGLVALTSKRPQAEPYHEVELFGGTQKQRGAAFDSTGALSDDGRVSYRITGVARASDAMQQGLENERYALAPSLALRLGDNTNLLLQAYLQNDPDNGYHGSLPYYGTVKPGPNGNKLATDFYEGEPGVDGFKRRQNTLGYQFDHAFNNNWQFKQNFRYLDSHVSNSQYYQNGWASDDTLARAFSGADERLEGYTVDNQLIAKLQTGTLAHTLLFGVDYQNLKNNGYWSWGTASDLDVKHPQYGNTALTGTGRQDFRRRLQQTGFYLQDQVAVDRWRLTLSGRYDRARVHNTNDFGSGPSSEEWKGSDFSGRAGVAYLFDNGVTPYFGYSESFNPNTSVGKDGKLLKPTQGKQYEGGVKYQPEGSKTLLAASLYDLTQSNVARSVPGQTYYEPLGEIRTRGVELEARTEVTRELSLIAGYSYNRMENKDSHKTPTQAPRHMASLWADYAFASGLGVGAGVRYIGTSWADDANTLKVPAYTLVDLSLRYDLGRVNGALKGATARLTAHNVFNKEYVASCVGETWCYWGQERTVTASVGYKW